jgi:hypothetical protein
MFFHHHSLASRIAGRLKAGCFGFAFRVLKVQEIVADLFGVHDRYGGFRNRHTSGPHHMRLERHR